MRRLARGFAGTWEDEGQIFALSDRQTSQANPKTETWARQAFDGLELSSLSVRYRRMESEHMRVQSG